MTHTVKLKKRYPRSGGKSHWMWVLRYWSADACKEIGEVIGWYAPARDSWHPKWCKGPRLTAAQAREVRIQRRNDLREGRVGQPETDADPVEANDPVVVPFVRWLDAYVEETRGTVRETSLKEIRDALRALNKAVAPPTAASVDHRMVKRFIKARLGKPGEGVEHSTVWKQISALRRVWYDARLEPNPWANPKLRKLLRFEEKDWHWYTPADFAKLMVKCDDWIAESTKPKADRRNKHDSQVHDSAKWRRRKGMVAVAYTAGLRLGEIGHLTWADVDFENEVVYVRSKKRTEETLDWTPKDYEKRVLPLAGLTREALERIRGDAEDGNPYVFIPAERYQHVMALAAAGKWREGRPILNNVLKDFHRLCRGAKVTVCEFHSLRKSFCTNLLEGAGGGKPMEPHAVQKLMGHSSVETTIRCYSKVRKDAISVAREIVDRVALPQQPTGKVKIA